MNHSSEVPVDLNFDNRTLRSLPVDTGKNNVRTVRNACFSKVECTPVSSPRIVVLSKESFELLDIPKQLSYLCDSNMTLHDQLAAFLSGNKLFPGSEPAAQCYCGYQFGSFAGQLGDGAAIYLGEVVNGYGERWELQLKGAGRTPFSRMADGRKVLRSSLREFLCSEAMHHLGIPTTRSASVVTSDTWVERDVFYTGRIIKERASITSRIAPTFIRFGSFEITKPMDDKTGRFGPSVGNKFIVAELANYVIRHFFPNAAADMDSNDLRTTFLSFLKEVVLRTAELVACWQTVGFCHGVLNTDNMSIIGLTIDYGPFGFMDRFMWDHICNASDTDGRYSYSQQPSVCSWNCLRLAECLVRAVVDKEEHTDNVSKGKRYNELLTEFYAIVDSNFGSHFRTCYTERMRKKLGLVAELDESQDEQLFKSLFDTMEKTGSDFTNTFLALEDILHQGFVDSSNFPKNLSKLNPQPMVANCCCADELREALEPVNVDMARSLLIRFAAVNRNFLERLDENKVLKLQDRLNRLKELEHVTDEEKSKIDSDLWQQWLDSYLARYLRDIDMKPDITLSDRLDIMRSCNPRLVLRNYLAEQAIKSAESGDYSVVRRLLDALRTPFVDQHSTPADNSVDHSVRLIPDPSSSDCISTTESDYFEALRGRSRPPAWARNLRVT